MVAPLQWPIWNYNKTEGRPLVLYIFLDLVNNKPLCWGGGGAAESAASRYREGIRDLYNLEKYGGSGGLPPPPEIHKIC